MTLGQREIRQLVGDVIVARGDDHIAGAEIESGEGLEERHSGIFHDGDIARLSAQETRDISVDLRNGRLGIVRALVGAKIRFACQVIGNGVQHGPGHQAGPRVIQMYAMGATRGFFAPLAYIVSHALHRSKTGEALSDWRVA